MDFLGNNLESCVTFFSTKLVLKVMEEQWDKVLAEYNNMDLIKLGDKGDVSMISCSWRCFQFGKPDEELRLNGSLYCSLCLHS